MYGLRCHGPIHSHIWLSQDSFRICRTATDGHILKESSFSHNTRVDPFISLPMKYMVNQPTVVFYVTYLQKATLKQSMKVFCSFPFIPQALLPHLARWGHILFPFHSHTEASSLLDNSIGPILNKFTTFLHAPVLINPLVSKSENPCSKYRYEEIAGVDRGDPWRHLYTC
jgi:hypothetical protein